MKFQLATAAAAILLASVTAFPAPVTNNHGLISDTDEWADDGTAVATQARDTDVTEAIETRDVDTFDVLEVRTTEISEAAANFNFTSDHYFALDKLLAQIVEIPEVILEQGDEALHKWLVDHGSRPDNTKLRRDAEDEDSTDPESPSLLERGELIARASWWKIAKCVAAIVQLLATTAVPAAKLLRIKKYIEALGGARQAVELLLKATSKAEKLKAGGEALVNLSAELLGISSVKSNCF